MAYTDFIVAIDLGSSHMVGMVGTKKSSGELSIIAYEVEKVETCIRRGCVYNIKETAYKIVGLVRKLENKLGGTRIAKIYVGVGGQSLRTIDHSVSKLLGNGVVTENTLQDIDKECRQYTPDLLNVLDIASPVYYLDNQLESNPIGLSCSRIDARYKLIVGRPALRDSVTKNMVEHIKTEVAGVIVSPLALADLILTEPEKENGCALIDFGAGVTSVTMYKAGKLVGMYVIPLGSHLITKDLMTLDNISEKEAERIKRTEGNAIWEKEKEPRPIPVDLADGRHASLKSSDVNNVVEARSREIIENIYARLEEAGMVNDASCKLVIAGNGSTLKNLREALIERFKMEVRYASVRKDFIKDGEMIANNPEYTTATALLLKGTENCAVIPEPVVTIKEPKPIPVESPVVEQEPVAVENIEVKKSDPEVKNPIRGGEKPKGGNKIGEKTSGFFGGFFDKVSGKLGEILDEQDD